MAKSSVARAACPRPVSRWWWFCDMTISRWPYRTWQKPLRKFRGVIGGKDWWKVSPTTWLRVESVGIVDLPTRQTPVGFMQFSRRIWRSSWLAFITLANFHVLWEPTDTSLLPLTTSSGWWNYVPPQLRQKNTSSTIDGRGSYSHIAYLTQSSGKGRQLSHWASSEHLSLCTHASAPLPATKK